MNDTDFERLNIILAARDREFARAMDRNTRRIERFAQRANQDLSAISKMFNVVGVAAKAATPLIAAIGGAAVIGKLKSTVAALDDIGKTADKIGITTDALQELRVIAESSGVGVGALDSSLERFNKRLGEAQQGGGAALKTLEALGLNAAELADMGLDEALSLVADTMARIEDPTQRAAAAAALFGREGVAMVNLLREGSAGMDQMRQEARDLGVVIDESLIRGAEDAQTKLDLMSRVIDAQLNSALVELAPLLVAGATAAADLVRFIGSAVDAVQELIEPQTQLQAATDNVVMAMGDEIRQSQLLETALGRGVSYSQAAAEAKLKEARSRNENAKAAIAEQRALVLGSDEFQGLTDQISTAQDALLSQGFNGDKATAARSDAYEDTQLHLVQLIQRRQELLKVNNDIQDQLDRTGENVAKLEAAIGSSGGGQVNIDGAVSPIDLGDRTEVKRTRAAAAKSEPELSNYAEVVRRVQNALGDAATQGGNYSSMLQQLEAMHAAGQLTGSEFDRAISTIDDKFEAASSSADRLRSAAGQAFSSILTGSASAGDALSGLLASFGGMFADAAFSSLFGGSDIFAGIGSLLSFDGGGDTPSGARSGGLDGKGGFLAMLHPDETVIDHTKGARSAGSGSGGAMALTVNVNGARGDAQLMEMVRAGVEQGIRQNNRHNLPRHVRSLNADKRKVS